MGNTNQLMKEMERCLVESYRVKTPLGQRGKYAVVQYILKKKL
jgi:hypothetical protein